MSKYIFECIDAHTCGNPVRLILTENPKTKIQVSVETKSVICEEVEFNFFLDDFSQNRILNGIDKIDISLEYENKIDEFMQNRNKWSPKLT